MVNGDILAARNKFKVPYNNTTQMIFLKSLSWENKASPLRHSLRRGFFCLRYYFVHSERSTGASIVFSAPGVDIISSLPDQGFASMSGTSMATPFISGLAAMLKLEDPTKSITRY